MNQLEQALLVARSHGTIAFVIGKDIDPRSTECDRR